MFVSLLRSNDARPQRQDAHHRVLRLPVVTNQEAHTPADIPSLRSGPRSAQKPEQLVILFGVTRMHDWSDELDPEFPAWDELAQHCPRSSFEPIGLLLWILALPAREQSPLSLARS